MTFIKHTGKYRQFIPKNPKKYTGRWPIIPRSEWERIFMQWLDMNPSIIEWKSESNYVNYYDPVRDKYRRYYPDFFVLVHDREGGTIKYLIEIKPHKETVPPRYGKKDSQKTKVHKQATYLTNKAKFKAAKEYCKKMGYNFKILTEKQLFR